MHNNRIPGRPPLAARDVVVRITTTVNGQEQIGTYDDIPVLSSGAFDASAGLWTIPSIPPSDNAQADFTPYHFLPSRSVAQATPFRLHAELVEPSKSGEPPGYQADNETEAWYVQEGTATHVLVGEAGVQARVANRQPTPGTLTTFEVAATYFSTAASGLESRDQFDVQVKIDLSPGLSLSPPIGEPAGRPFDPATGIWEVGHIGDGERHTLSVPVTAAADGIPLVRCCLTATIVNALPDFVLDPEKRENDVTTVCLGDDPPVVDSDGEIILWWQHDCVGNAVIPCGADDELKLFARADHDEISLPGVRRRDEFGRGVLLGVTYLDPESVIVQVRDPAGRRYDSNSHSVTNSTTVSWQTGQTDYDNHPGVKVWYSRTGYNANIADWKNLVRTVSVSGLDGGDAPGRVKVRNDHSSGTTFYDPNPSHQRAPLNLTSATTVHNDYFLEFDSLGTYVVNFHVLAKRDDANETGYEASGNYVFHVAQGRGKFCAHPEVEAWNSRSCSYIDCDLRVGKDAHVTLRIIRDRFSMFDHAFHSHLDDLANVFDCLVRRCSPRGASTIFEHR